MINNYVLIIHDDCFLRPKKKHLTSSSYITGNKSNSVVAVWVESVGILQPSMANVGI